MGDRTYTSIRFAGVINEEDVGDLIEAINADGLQCDDGPESRTLLAEHLSFQLYDEEANYGELNATEAVCRQLHVSYMKEWHEGGGYGPGAVIYNGTFDQDFECGMVGGEPAVTLSDLEKAGSVEALVGYLKAFNDFEKNYGTLEIKPLETEDA